MTQQIVLIDTCPSDGWRGRSGIFDEGARSLKREGHSVRLIDEYEIASLPQAPNLLTGLNRAIPVTWMTNSHRLAHELSRRPPDLIIAPLRGGIAQAILMARACGEAFTATRVALWGNQPTRNRFLTSDSAEFDLGTVIADALERQCLDLADALIVPDGKADMHSLPGVQHKIPTVHYSRKAGVSPANSGRTQVREIAFIGALQRWAGAGEFVEAIERLARKGLIGDRLVTFVGPVTESFHGLSREWLGQKASKWNFPFTVVEEADRARALRFCSEPGRLAVCLSSDADELHALRATGRPHVALPAQPLIDPHLATKLENALALALRDDNEPLDCLGEVHWAKLVADLSQTNLSTLPSEADRVTVCVLHYNRLHFLRQALASIPEVIDGKGVEVIVIDNASPIPAVEDEIREAASHRSGLRVLSLSEPVSQTSAYNRGLAEAHSDIVVFLDDDNVFLAGGLERLARAASSRSHEIVVTSLEVFDDVEGDPFVAASVGRLIFLGTAHSAGLFFNAFGDTAMAVRRDAFVALGGFLDLGYDYPSLDWVTLAKAQGSGLRIGALQWPAVRYRRNTIRADIQAVKLDEAGARALVFAACGDSIDARLIARYAQKLLLLDL